ncbi:fibronectin type III domain-containing protein [Candidatus Poriferisodalis sp.]|uniref:fibronectin type III domain-containing protein n=1 Tax=Candidatus Poriferisodalis sp. TaxID=3101277 RepID=UPI003B5A520F
MASDPPPTPAMSTSGRRRRRAVPAALAAMALAAAVLSPAVGASSSSLHPKGLSASLADGTVTLSWNAPVDDAEGVTGYQVLRRRPGADAVGTFHVIADDTATSDLSFVDRCADQPGTAYTYRVKARRGDQLSRWGNYSRIDLAAGYVAADPQTGCDPDTGAPPTTTNTDPDNNDNNDEGDGNNDEGDGNNDDGDPDDGEGGVADSAVAVDSSHQQNNQNNKQFVPDPDDEGVVLRSSHPNTGTVQFQDRSTLAGLPASYPNSLGYDPGEPPASATADEITGHSTSSFVPRNVAAELTHDGITISWQQPSELSACADYERVDSGGAQTVLRRRPHPDVPDAWIYEYVPVAPKWECIDDRPLVGFEVYRTSFGHVYRNGSIVNLSDNQPYVVGTTRSQLTRPGGSFVFEDTSRDALVGLRRHNYQVRTLYGLDADSNHDRDFGSRLSADTWIEREHDAAQPNAQSPQNLATSIPTKDAVSNGATLGIHLDWNPPTTDASSVTEYVVQRRIVSARDRMLPYEDIHTITDTSTTSWIDTTTPDVVDTANQRLLRWRQFLYRVIAVRGTDRSNPSAEASTDSDRQLPADGLLTVTSVSRTGAVFRINTSGNDAEGNPLSDSARNSVMYSGYAKLLGVHIGTKSVVHYPVPDDTFSPPRPQGTPPIVDMGVSGLEPNTTYTAEVAFYIPAEETHGQEYVPTHTGGFNSGGHYGPRHLVGIVTFTTLP